STPTPAQPSSLDSERAIVGAAKAAIKRGDFADALVQLGQHAARYPTGIMAEDREALRVVTLCRLGRASEAATARTKVLARWPSSMHAARVRAACPDEDGKK